MKTTLRSVLSYGAVGFALAALLQSADLVGIPGVSTAALAGGFVACGAIALLLGDYARKPSFRVRRSLDASADAGPTVNRPAGPGPDWTYTTRTK